jgi:hypothetical protein
MPFLKSILLLIVLTVAFISIGQTNQFTIDHISQEEPHIYSKVEFGIVPSAELTDQIKAFLTGNYRKESEKVNPFVSFELDITATFIHESGFQESRLGFYYRAMDRDERINGWRDVENPYPLRVRWSPEKAGKWQALIQIKVHGKEVFKSEPIGLEVANKKKNAGFTQLNDRKTHFERDNELIIPTGINLPGPYMGNNMLYSLIPEERLKLDAWRLFRDDVERYAQEGGKYFRFFMSPSSSEIEFEELGNYYQRMNFAWEIDKMFEICEKFDVQVVFNMMLHTPFMVFGDYYQFRWDFSTNWPDPNAWPYKDPNVPYCYESEFGLKLPSEMFLREDAMRYIKERYRYMIARWGYSTSIMMFEPMSEPWHIDEDGYNHVTPYNGENGDSARKAAHVFHREITQYIKNDLGHKRHLFGAVGRLPMGQSEPFSHPVNPKMNYLDSTWFVDGIDVISISYYSASPEKMILSKRGKNNLECEDGENSIRCSIERLQSKYNKPVFFVESDHGDGTHVCSNLQGLRLDLMRYPITGMAGHFVWAAFGYTFGNIVYAIDERDGWPNAYLAHNYFNSSFAKSVLSDARYFGRERGAIRGLNRPAKNHEYVLTADRMKALGYIYNRTFSVHTMGAADGAPIEEGSPCFMQQTDYRQFVEATWKPNRMKLEGLAPRQRYRLRFYDYTNGRFVNEFEIRANVFGNSVLVHPVLDTAPGNSPLYWYQLEAF